MSDPSANTAGGTGALVNVTPLSGHANTAFGFQALFSTTSGDQNTANGSGALYSNTTGTYNTATGHSALYYNTDGFHNVATGVQTLYRNTTGTHNVATGSGALFNNTTGVGNVASGAAALFDNTTGDFNTGNGNSALNRNSTGNNNTAHGSEALYFNTTGNLNTASGFQALQNNIDGASNTAIGAKALKKALGTKNIGIGYQAGVTLQTGNNNIYIGNQGAGDEFQSIRIGTAQEQTFIAGINTAGVSGTAVVVDANGQLGITLSSARYKQDIAPMGTRSEKVLDLRPVTFAYKDDSKGTTHYGLVAEQVATVYPELVTRTATGEVQTVKYQELIPMLLNELQRQRQEFQQTLQTQQQALQTQAQALPSQQQAFHRQQQELAELRAVVGQGRETASLSR